ncbi:hypothetical protein [Streptomyces sp. NPDC048603]|uniref:hypothetical protein n=1 Tax=Streptomyces sp. NPDC048603 TaxID=3365577 RepID=UPI00371327DB
MISPQILAKGDVSTILTPDSLKIERFKERKKIPLAAVREVHPDGDKALKIVLTDGVVQRIEGGNPTATGMFLTALEAALPEERDPAGSALVTTEATTGEIKMWWVVAGIAAVLLAYGGYVYWVGHTYGVDEGMFAFLSVPWLLFSLLCAAAFVSDISDRVVLARRGVTVLAAQKYYPNGKQSGYYKFTDTMGNEYSQHAPRRSTENIHVVYDPQRPSRHAPTETLLMVVLKRTFLGLLVGGCLWLGVIGIVYPYR